jgi:hypothetical protein
MVGASERGKPPNALRAKGGRERRRRRRDIKTKDSELKGSKQSTV